jgi:pimeloyl-ACP methyl ester carboxylesterase
MSISEVLLVHGLGSTFEQNWRRPGWVDVLEADGLTPRPVRLPGHGGAALDHSPADAVLAAAAQAREPVAAVGFSAGAIAVLNAAAAEPHRFARIAVLGIGDHVLATAPAAVRPLVAALRRPAEPEDVRARTFWRLIRRSGNDHEQVASYLESAPLGVAADRLRHIRCPVLVAVGARDEAMPADRLAGALPDARLVVLPGVDHFATVSALAAMDAVSRFLTES